MQFLKKFLQKLENKNNEACLKELIEEVEKINNQTLSCLTGVTLKIRKLSSKENIDKAVLEKSVQTIRREVNDIKMILIEISGVLYRIYYDLNLGAENEPENKQF